MSTILIVILIILLLGGGGGYYWGNVNWGPGGGIGILGVVLVICLIVWLLQGRLG